MKKIIMLIVIFCLSCFCCDMFAQGTIPPDSISVIEGWQTSTNDEIDAVKFNDNVFVNYQKGSDSKIDLIANWDQGGYIQAFYDGDLR